MTGYKALNGINMGGMKMNATVKKSIILLLLGLFLWGCGTVSVRQDYQPAESLCDRLPQFDNRTCWEGRY